MKTVAYRYFSRPNRSLRRRCLPPACVEPRRRKPSRCEIRQPSYASSKKGSLELRTPAEFDRYRAAALERGFLECVSGPLVRSSYRAEQALARNNAGLDNSALVK